MEGTNTMMHHLGINLNITCKKPEVLERLKTNREQHKKLVAEAKAGYVERAKIELEKRLVALREGKVVNLVFTLKVPKDFTTVYDTSIGMLEAHTKPEIDLSADEYRHLMEDNWDWTREFISLNSTYSKSTQDYGAGKGFFDIE